MVDHNESEMKVTRRWTPSIIEAGGGFTPIANLFLRSYASLKLSPTDAMLIVHMMHYRWDHRPLAISSDAIAREMGLTAGQVRNRLRAIEKKGLIALKREAGKPNTYDFRPLLVELEAIIANEKVETLSNREDADNYFREISEAALTKDAVPF